MADLTGKYVFISNEDYYTCGQIIDKVADEFYMVKKFPTNGNGITVNVVHSLYDMVPGEDFIYWGFFDTKEELDKYVSWIEEPDEPDNNSRKIFKLVKD